MAFEKIISVRYRHQDLPLGPSDMFFRIQILLSTVLLRGDGICTTRAFDGEEGTAGSAVRGGCWSWKWPAGKAAPRKGAR
jgi:hypothetical protein